MHAGVDEELNEVVAIVDKRFVHRLVEGDVLKVTKSLQNKRKTVRFGFRSM